MTCLTTASLCDQNSGPSCVRQSRYLYLLGKLKAANLLNTPASYFSHNNPVSWIGPKENDRPKVTQLVFMPKPGLELTTLLISRPAS